MIMTKANVDVEWGNIELPGLSDEELFRRNWNRVAAMREKHQDSDYQQRYQLAMKSLNQATNAKLWHASEKGQLAYQRGRNKIKKPVIDPNGKVWPSVSDAAPTWFPNHTKERATKTIRYLISKNIGWKYEG